MKFKKLTDGVDLSLTEREMLIDERLFSARDRYIMKRALLDDAKYEVISEEVGLSTRHTKEIASRCMKTLIQYINEQH